MTTPIPLPMLVLLEGSDGAGKSTLAHELCERYDLDYVHMGLPKPIDQPFRYWWAKLRHVKRPTLIDRLHWSEDVYGPLFRGGSHLDFHERWLLEGWLLAHGVTVVRCRVPLETALANAALAPDNVHHDPAQVEAAWCGYEGPWNTTLPVLTYDYTTGEPLAELPSRPALSFKHVGIGSPTPRVVFVGDRHNSCGEGCRETPFVFNSLSGRYLCAALDEAGLDLNEYHVLNGWHFHRGIMELTEIPIAWAGARFVALGNSAARALNGLGFEVADVVPHPQFWRRFHYSQLSAYAQMLRTAATRNGAALRLKGV